MVDNLSKIRIKLNDKIEDNSSVIDRDLEERVKALNLFVDDIPEDKATNSSGSDQIPSSTSSPQKIYWNNLSENQRKDYKSFKNLIRNVNNLKDIDNKEVTISLSEDNSDDWESVCVNGQTSQTKDKAINYLDIELSPIYNRSSISKVLSYKTIVIEVHNQKVIGMRFFFQDYKAIQQLMQLINDNRHCFEINRSSNSVDNPKWKLMSEQMIINAYQEWTPQKCRDGFINAMDLYRKVLKN